MVLPWLNTGSKIKFRLTPRSFWRMIPQVMGWRQGQMSQAACGFPLTLVGRGRDGRRKPDRGGPKSFALKTLVSKSQEASSAGVPPAVRRASSPAAPMGGIPRHVAGTQPTVQSQDDEG